MSTNAKDLDVSAGYQAMLDSDDWKGVAAGYSTGVAKPGDHALAAIAYFQLEQYGSSAAAYELAVQEDPGNIALQEMRTLAHANATSEVNVPVPDVQYFQTDALVAPAPVEGLKLPTPRHLRTGIMKRFRRLVGAIVGFFATIIMTLVI
jgi:hypothetical protein